MDKGVVRFVDGKNVRVALEGGEECSSCSAMKICGKREERVVDGVSSNYLSIGDRVKVNMSTKSLMSVLALGYGIPLVLLVVSFVGLHFFIKSEWLLALCSISISMSWFMILRLFRRSFKTEIECFRIDSYQ